MSFKKFLTASLVAALAMAVFTPARADDVRIGTSWKSVDVVIRTSTTAGGEKGYIDSTRVSWGAVNSADTSTAINISDIANATVDSLQFIRVGVIGSSAFASGDSVYVTFDGSHDGNTFTDLGNPAGGTCMAGGYCAAGALVPGATTGISKLYNGAGSATAVGIAAGLAPAGPGRNLVYGNFGGFPIIRLRFKTDSAGAPIPGTVRFRLWYLSASGGGP